jgi:serine/threonine protein kinase
MTRVDIPALPDRLAQRYDVGPVIGRGVGSTVFRAHDTLLGRDAAVKTFRVETDARARRELSLLAMMDHPGLVPVYDVEEHDGRAFVVMALLDGGSLADRLGGHGGGDLTLPAALRTAGTVAGALDHIHRAGVLHRDVTPGNVLYDDDGRAHLSDFGVAFVADAPRITDTGLTVGAAPYLAPEQVRGEPAGPPADVYALGLVLIEALTGRRAFPGDPLSAAQARLDRGPSVPDGLPRPVADLIAAMTRADPAARPGAAEVSVALRQALVEAEPATMPPMLSRSGVATSGPAARTGSPFPLWPSTRDRLSPTRRPGTPRATGTRGVLLLAGLAASAVLAGTVAIATSGPVQIAADSARPAAIVPGGATVGAPDPYAALALPPAAPAPSSGSVAPTSDPGYDTTAAAAAPTSRPAPVRSSPTREAGSSTPRTSTKHSTPTRTTSPTRNTDEDEGTDPSPTRTRPEGAVGGVLRGVGGLVGGVLDGGR